MPSDPALKYDRFIIRVAPADADADATVRAVAMGGEAEDGGGGGGGGRPRIPPALPAEPPPPLPRAAIAIAAVECQLLATHDRSKLKFSNRKHRLQQIERYPKKRSIADRCIP